MNRNVIYTVITGGYDTLKSQPKVDGFDYICFTDDINLKSDCWKIVPLPEDVDGLSDAKKNRKVKILAHRYLPEYNFSIYIDANIDVKSEKELLSFIKQNCTEDKGYFFAGQHPYNRDCIYDEAIALIGLKKDKQETIEKQVDEYRKEGFPKHFGLTQNGILFRYHNNEDCKELMECWWNEVKQKSHRDQLSLFYAKWKTDKHIIQNNF